MVQLRYGILPQCHVAVALALEEYLLRHREGELALLWHASPSVVIGKYQSVVCETKPSLLQEQGIGLYRRFTGGGAVYLDGGTLLFTHIGATSGRSFASISHQMQTFLAKAGYPTEADDRLSLYYKGAKVQGVAQAVQGSRQLFHATLLVESNLQALEEALQPEQPHLRPRVASCRAKVTNLPTRITSIEAEWPSFMEQQGAQPIAKAELQGWLQHPTVQQWATEKYNNPTWTLEGASKDKRKITTN